MISRLRRRLRAQEGYAMALVMGVLIFAGALGLAAWGAAKGDIGLSGDSRDRKQAYAAAEAGVNWYLARLTSDNDYWTKCTAVPAVAPGVPAPVNEAWNGVKVPAKVTATNPEGDPRIWRTLAGSTAQYTVELIPAPGNSVCSQSGMIDETGSFRIRATGKFNGKKRSIIARIARTRFLDFLYFTNYETTDPLAYASGDVSDANTYCADRYREARDNNDFNCREIRFVDFDDINGPLHSNDSLLICGAAKFGRTGRNDKINTSAATLPTSHPGWYQDGGSSCSANPVFRGTFKYAQEPLTMPSTNDSLAASAGLTLFGSNRIVFQTNGTMSVTNLNSGVTTNNVAVPTNGLIYVETDTSIGGCSRTVPPTDVEYGPSSSSYFEPYGCANAYVSGTYNKSITVASAKDVIVVGSLAQLSGSDSMAGLIANNFVRVYHPITSHGSGNCSGSNITSSNIGSNGNAARAPFGPVSTNVRIDAAILTLAHSFTVDSYDCGDQLGDLTVSGAIAQKYRGAVGTSAPSGYAKDYNYDDRLKYRNPPLFLDPINAAWKVVRTNEQLPPR